jgi:RNA polymerase sigma-70 factor (ECF subfamily)
MAPSSELSDTAPRSGPAFVTTHWSVVLAAQDKGSPQEAGALETLCRIYWWPLYAYVRRLGHGPHDAEDLTQEFFARLLQKDYLRAVDRAKGRFRTFLLMAVNRFRSDEWDRIRAQKRGGRVACFSLDAQTAEQRYRLEPADQMTPERIFERHWALTLLDRTVNRLGNEFAAAGKADQFEQLKGFLTAERGAISHAEVAPRLGLSEGALRVAVHRLRRRYREIFREEIAHTVARPEEIEEEVRHLLAVLSQ